MNFDKLLNKLIFIKPIWSTATNVKIEQITGGISNKIYKISSDNLGVLLIRIYGQQMQNLINRKVEIEIFKFVSDRNVGPKLLGLFNDGRVEEYINAMPLNENDIIKFRPKIINKIKEINLLSYSGNLVCWERLFKWNQMLIDKKLSNFKNEINMLFKRIQTFPQDHILLKQTFCHNDLLPQNILCDENENIYIIDFEYAGINYIGLELANHVIYYDFENIKNKYDEVYNFLKEYLDRNPTMIDLEIMKFFIKLTYLTWLIWGLISNNCENQDIDFNYFEYIEICKKNYNNFS